MPKPPSSHTPLLAVAHVLSLSISSVFSRKPHCAHCVAYGHIVGRYEFLPPSRHLVSPSTTLSHVFWHSVKGMYGGIGGGEGGAMCGTLGGAEGAMTAPVTVKARSFVRCSAAQLRAHTCSPSFSPGHCSVRWLARKARSIVCALVMRLTSADAWPCSASKRPSAPPPRTCSPSSYAG